MLKFLKVYFTMIFFFFGPTSLSCRSSVDVGGVLAFAASLLWGTCKLRNETRNEIYRNETKRNEIRRSETKFTETKRNRCETK